MQFIHSHRRPGEVGALAKGRLRPAAPSDLIECSPELSPALPAGRGRNRSARLAGVSLGTTCGGATCGPFRSVAGGRVKIDLLIA